MNKLQAKHQIDHIKSTIEFRKKDIANIKTSYSNEIESLKKHLARATPAHKDAYRKSIAMKRNAMMTQVEIKQKDIARMKETIVKIKNSISKE